MASLKLLFIESRILKGFMVYFEATQGACVACKMQSSGRLSTYVWLISHV